MSEVELQETLKKIEEAMKEKDPKRQEAFLSGLVDPQDALACDGCQ